MGSPLFDYSNLSSLSDSWVLIILLQETTFVSHKINWTVMKNEWWSFEEMQSLFEWDSSLEKYWDLSAIIIGRNEVIGRKFGFTSWLVMQMRLPLPLSCSSQAVEIIKKDYISILLPYGLPSWLSTLLWHCDFRKISLVSLKYPSKEVFEK